MDWLTFLILLVQALIAFPVILFLSYVIGWGFAAGASGSLASMLKPFIAARQKKNEKDIL